MPYQTSSHEAWWALQSMCNLTPLRAWCSPRLLFCAHDLGHFWSAARDAHPSWLLQALVLQLKMYVNLPCVFGVCAWREMCVAALLKEPRARPKALTGMLACQALYRCL